MKMRRAKSEPSAFLDVEKQVILIVHVDDLLIFGPLKLIQEFYEELQSKVLLKLVGLLKNPGDEVMYVGHKLRMIKGGFSWSGGDKLITALLEETGLQHAKCMSTPAVRPTAQQEVEAELLQQQEATRYRSCLGKLMYLANDHPDIEFAVNCLARRASKPTHLDEQRLKRVVRYLRGHPTARWEFIAATPEPPPALIVYTDADWGGDILTRRSTSGGIMTWGEATTGTWAKLQPVVSLSSAEAEYYCIVAGVQRTLAIQALLNEASIATKLIVRSDSLAAKQSVEKVGLLHVKHMSMRMMFLKDLQRAGCIEIEKVLGTENPADMFTKPLIEVVDRGLVQTGRNLGMKEQLLDTVFDFLIWLGECMKLILFAGGFVILMQQLLCRRRGKSTRSVATQSQCTYTALRKVLNPRFEPLNNHLQGVFED